MSTILAWAISGRSAAGELAAMCSRSVSYERNNNRKMNIYPGIICNHQALNPYAIYDVAVLSGLFHYYQVLPEMHPGIRYQPIDGGFPDIRQCLKRNKAPFARETLNKAASCNAVRPRRILS
jgi:hypothetical protein